MRRSWFIETTWAANPSNAVVSSGTLPEALSYVLFLSVPIKCTTNSKVREQLHSKALGTEGADLKTLFLVKLISRKGIGKRKTRSVVQRPRDTRWTGIFSQQFDDRSPSVHESYFRRESECDVLFFFSLLCLQSSLTHMDIYLKQNERPFFVCKINIHGKISHQN